MRSKGVLLFAFFVALQLVCLNAWAQSKIILDKASTGGYCNNFFDLDDHGFALIFNKNKDVDEGVGTSATLTNNVYYYSKDLSKRAFFKVSSNGIFTLNATKNHLVILDRLSTKYYVRLYDFAGKELVGKRFDLEEIGLNQDLVSEIHYTSTGNMIFEVYDGHDQLHLYKINLLNPQENALQEMDFQLPSSNPLESMKFHGNWHLIAENTGYYIMAKKGSNTEFDPNAIAYHVAFYDEEFNLFRELLLDNFLMPNVQMIGKEASFDLNPTLQSFVVTCLIFKNGKPGFMAANYGMNPGSSVMNQLWHKEFDLIDNEKHKLVEHDGLSVPPPPIIGHKGPKIIIRVMKGRTNVQEESLNQMVIFDGQGKVNFNEVQMGSFENLNLDGFCVDNNNLYSRIKKLQMGAVLKPYCEQKNVDVLDIDLDPSGHELAIVRNYDITKNQVIIYRFTAK